VCAAFAAACVRAACLQVFGVWRTRAGRHRRIDIVVCSYPEELPLCRLTWVGGRLLNRLMRGYCLTHGLWLSAHALLVKSTGAPLLIDDDEARMVVRVPAAGEAAPAIVPYKFLRNERDVLYLLAGGSDAFFGLLDTRNRNA
jgi:DNA polymerase mu